MPLCPLCQKLLIEERPQIAYRCPTIVNLHPISKIDPDLNCHYHCNIHVGYHVITIPPFSITWFVGLEVVKVYQYMNDGPVGHMSIIKDGRCQSMEEFMEIVNRAKNLIIFT